jgi:MATE family multidrug resistance protein
MLSLIDSTRKFLSTMGYQNGPMIIQISATVLHNGWCYLFTDYMEMGVHGTALATTITYLVSLIAFEIYVKKFTEERLLKEAWFLPSKECFDWQGIKDFMKMGIASIGMMCLEWWSFEIMAIIAAFISVQAVATQVIVLNTAVISFMPVLGL